MEDFLRKAGDRPCPECGSSEWLLNESTKSMPGVREADGQTHMNPADSTHLRMLICKKCFYVKLFLDEAHWSQV